MTTAAAALARPRGWPYLNGTDRRAVATHRRAGCLAQMVADGSPAFDAAAASRGIAAGAQGRAGGGGRGCGPRHCPPDPRAGVVVPLWDGDLLRDDHLRHLRLFLTRQKGI